MNWQQRLNNHVGIWERLLNPTWVTESLHRSQKGPNMVLNSNFSQPCSLLRSFLKKQLIAFWPDEDNVIWPPCFNDRFGIWKHPFNPIWIFDPIKDIMIWPPRSNDHWSVLEKWLAYGPAFSSTRKGPLGPWVEIVRRGVHGIRKGPSGPWV